MPIDSRKQSRENNANIPQSLIVYVCHDLHDVGYKWPLTKVRKKDK